MLSSVLFPTFSKLNYAWMPFKTRNVILFCWTQKFVLFSLSEIQFVIVGGGTRTRVINSSNSQWGSIIWVTQCTADTTAREGGRREGEDIIPSPTYWGCFPNVRYQSGDRCDDWKWCVEARRELLGISFSIKTYIVMMYNYTTELRVNLDQN